MSGHTTVLREANIACDQDQAEWFGPPWRVYGSGQKTTDGHHIQPCRVPKNRGESISAVVRGHQLYHLNVRGKKQICRVEVRHDPRLQRWIVLMANRNTPYIGLVTARNRNQEMVPVPRASHLALNHSELLSAPYGCHTCSPDWPGPVWQGPTMFLQHNFYYFYFSRVGRYPRSWP